MFNLKNIFILLIFINNSLFCAENISKKRKGRKRKSAETAEISSASTTISSASSAIKKPNVCYKDQICKEISEQRYIFHTFPNEISNLVAEYAAAPFKMKIQIQFEMEKENAPTKNAYYVGILEGIMNINDLKEKILKLARKHVLLGFPRELDKYFDAYCFEIDRISLYQIGAFKPLKDEDIYLYLNPIDMNQTEIPFIPYYDNMLNFVVHYNCDHQGISDFLYEKMDNKGVHCCFW